MSSVLFYTIGIAFTSGVFLRSFFDIGSALYTWEEEDRRYFFASLSLQAEIIDQIKKEEL